MRLKPPLQTKPLNTCGAAELIRFWMEDESRIAIVSDVPGWRSATHAIIILNPPGQSKGPVYEQIPTDNDMLVLSHGEDYEFTVTDNPPFVSGFDSQFESVGAMLVGLDSALIRVPPAKTGLATIYYDISSGRSAVGLGKPKTQLALLAWNIRLLSANKDAAPVFSFSVS